MSAWQPLVTAALIGTERQSPKIESLPGIELAVPESTEVAVLQAAAALTLYRLAGARSTEQGKSEPAQVGFVSSLPRFQPPGIQNPAGPESMPIASPRSAIHLDLILNGPHGELLEEWLQAAAKNNKRASAINLPHLLDQGIKKRQLRPLIRPTLGERGRWLAAQNPEWAWAVTSNDLEADSAQELWETGTPEDRLVALEAVRSAVPARARTMVESTWESDAATDRADFITRLQPGLSLSDEPFLERALDDKRKEVRRAAADLLCLLPDSALSRRMLRRVEPLITIKRGGFLGGERIEVALPEACDPAMARDGIDQKPNEPGMGEKAAWMKQMLGRIPPAQWSRSWGRTPEQILQMAGKSEWKEVLIGGWVQATDRNHDAAWADALMHWCATNNPTTQRPNDLTTQRPNHSDDKALTYEWLTAAMRVAPPARVDSFLEERIGPANSLDVTAALLPAHRNPWSPRLTSRLLNAIRGRMHKGGQNAYAVAYQIRELLKLARQYAAPSMYQEALDILQDAPSDIIKPVDEFLMTLRLRNDMLRALKED